MIYVTNVLSANMLDIESGDTGIFSVTKVNPESVKRLIDRDKDIVSLIKIKSVAQRLANELNISIPLAERKVKLEIGDKLILFQIVDKSIQSHRNVVAPDSRTFNFYVVDVSYI